ncbi:CUE domain-containing protein 1-like [Argopecten irradians]|uniref:CUE domain-containing protein 1-like n=1 Tax=Argopecten irradians TaxID=31199 RepID=UPI00371369CE
MATADTTQPQKHSSRRRSRNQQSSRMENDFVPNNSTSSEIPGEPSSHGHHHHHHHHHKLPRQSSRPTKQLDFYQAMSDFKTMFPMMENDVIEAVLRANDGAVDATIDQLLTMSIDNDGSESPVTVPSDLISPLSDDCPEYNEERTEDSPPSYTEAVHSQASTSIWTTPISSQAKDQSTSSTIKNKSPSGSLKKEQPNGNKRSPSSSVGPRFRGLDLLDADVDELSLSNTELKRPLPNSDITQSRTPKRYYRNWNPPMLGTLPEDFLRLSVAPQVPSSLSLASPPMLLSHGHQTLDDMASSHDVTPKSQSVRQKHSKSSRSHSERKRMSRSLSEKTSEKSWLASSQNKDTSPLMHQSSFSASRGSTPGSKSLMISSLEFSQDMLDEKMKENERRRKRAVMNADPEMSQYLEDERLAIMLQNSEFLDELRSNEDFMKTLERDRMNLSAFEPIPEPPEQLPPLEHEGYGEDSTDRMEAFPFSQPIPKEKDDDAELRRQLNNMGGASRKQFVALAKKFFSRKKKKMTLKQIQKEKLAPSMVNLLDSDEEDYNAHDHMDHPYNQRTEIEPLPSSITAVPSYKTVQRPPYHPETITSYHDNQATDMV